MNQEQINETYQATKSAIAEMLRENTGRHFLDSGGASGRHWQANRRVTDFDSRPYFSDVEFQEHRGSVDILYTVDLYHWLSERLWYSQENQDLYESFAAEDLTYFADGEAFVAMLEESATTNVAGICGDGTRMDWLNTYNEENVLSQNFAFLPFEVANIGGGDPEILPDGDYVLVSIHGGCDARGGYTAPRLFEIVGPSGPEDIFDFHNGFLSFDCDAPANLTREMFPDLPRLGSVRWHADGDGEISDASGRYLKSADLRDYPVSWDARDIGRGYVVLDQEDPEIAYCPLTGSRLVV